MDLEEIIDIMVSAFNKGKRVVRLHTGDPSLYGAIYEQIVQLEKRKISYRIIPGVTAAFGAAASMGIEYTVPDMSQTLILTRMAGRTPVPETENLEKLAAHQTTMAIYLSMSQIEKVAPVLESAYGPHSICAVVYRATHPDERIIYIPLKKLAETVRREDITRQALIIVGDVLKIQLEKQDLRSKLYDGTFSHGYREKMSGNNPIPEAWGDRRITQMDTEKKKIVIWSLTLSGAETALKIREQLETRYRIVIMVPEGLSVVSDAVTRFDHLKRAVAERFNHYNGHIFIMAAGIAVRMIAPLIRHKTKDPAVVVVDERGRHAISLLSGHIGGANTLARDTAHAIGGQAVITTATDVNDLPAIDEIATNKGLSIENPEAIKAVHMALLEGEKIRIFDPYELIRE